MPFRVGDFVWIKTPDYFYCSIIVEIFTTDVYIRYDLDSIIGDINMFVYWKIDCTTECFSPKGNSFNCKVSTNFEEICK